MADETKEGLPIAVETQRSNELRKGIEGIPKERVEELVRRKQALGAFASEETEFALSNLRFLVKLREYESDPEKKADSPPEIPAGLWGYAGSEIDSIQSAKGGLEETETQLRRFEERKNQLGDQLQGEKDSLERERGRNFLMRKLRGGVRKKTKNEIDTLEKEIIGTDLLEREAESQERKYRDTLRSENINHRDALIIRLSTNSIEDIFAQYRYFGDELCRDDQLRLELASRFVKDVALPDLQRHDNDSELSPEEKEEILDLLPKYLVTEERDRKLVFLIESAGLYKTDWGGTICRSLNSLESGGGFTEVLKLIAWSEAESYKRQFIADLQKDPVASKLEGSEIYELRKNTDDLALQFSRAAASAWPSSRHNIDSDRLLLSNLSPIARQEWGTVKRSTVIGQLFREEQWNTLEKTLAEQMSLTALISTRDYRDAEALFWVARQNKELAAELAPVIVLSAWSQFANAGGHYPLLESQFTYSPSSGDSEIFKFTSSLSEDDIGKIEQQGISGLTEAIRLIRDNPDNFNTQFFYQEDPQRLEFLRAYADESRMVLSDAEEEIARFREGRFSKDPAYADYERSIRETMEGVSRETGLNISVLDMKEIPNPVYERLYQRLEDVAIAAISSSDPRSVLLGTRFFMEKDGATPEVYETISRVLENVDSSYKKALIDALSRRAMNGDAAALKVLLFPYEEETRSQIHETFFSNVVNRPVMLKLIRDKGELSREMAGVLLGYVTTGKVLGEGFSQEPEVFFNNLKILLDETRIVGENNKLGNFEGMLLSDESLKLLAGSPEALGKIQRLIHEVLEKQDDHASLDYLTSHQVFMAIMGPKVNPELIFALPQQAKVLLNERWRETKSLILSNADLMLKDATDWQFLNSLIGEFGNKADQLIKGYKNCLAVQVITREDKAVVLEFIRQIKALTPEIMKMFKEAKAGGSDKIFLSQLRATAGKMVGSGLITAQDREKPYYQALLAHVYSNNSGTWGSIKGNNSCDDRSGDLADFSIQPKYAIDLLSQGDLRIKDGQSLDPDIQKRAQAAILSVKERMSSLGSDNEKVKTDLKVRIDDAIEEVVRKGGLAGLNLKTVSSSEERLFLLITDSVYGTRSLDPNILKEMLITYEFANFDQIDDYIAGTRDRVGRAGNQDYALLCELDGFYSDRIKEAARRLVRLSWDNPSISALMPEYFRKLSQEEVISQREDVVNRLQIEKLGDPDEFVKRIGKVLEKRFGREYSLGQVRDFVRRYESMAQGLVANASTSSKPGTKAFYGQLRSQREKTLGALRTLTGQEINPVSVHLGDINLQEALEVEAGIKEGSYDAEQFASYTTQKFIDLFVEERVKIGDELDKFESTAGQQREVLYGYITKNKESANARMVGGVCVSGDNPDRGPRNMWDMPNYLQLVFQEPDTLQCQGLVLLHRFTEGGKRVLAASFNPSSTYLYSVDERILFGGIMNVLEEFAKTNNFDQIVTSQNMTIRSNRTGGMFEEEMVKRIRQIGKTFTFADPQIFSYTPSYKIKEMDVVWERA